MDEYTIEVCTIKTNKDGFESLAKITYESKQFVMDIVILNFASCSFFDANMVAPFHTIITKLRDDLNLVKIKNIHYLIQNILQKNRYLTQFGFSEKDDVNHTTLPFKVFQLTAGAQFSDYLDNLMDGKGIPRMSTALTKKFRQSLFEIFQNAAIHSKSTQGIFVCGQSFPNLHKLKFTISDSGCGIRENVRAHLGDTKISSIKAIKWALKEGNSTKQTGHPGGLGLKFLQEFIELNKGKIQIASRYGYCQIECGLSTFNKMEHDFPGTCVNIEINTNDNSTYCLTSEKSNGSIF